jgi:hypothetical protein
MSEETVKKGRNPRHKPDCKCPFCGGPRPKRQKKADAPVVGKFKDELDRKLDYFQYTLDPKEAALWEHDESLSPLYVPADVKRRYPHLAWRWVSRYKLDNKGDGYNGWQLFKGDVKYPEGIRRGNDMFLAAMPKKMAESYRRRVAERSSSNVRDVQYGQIAKMEQAARQLQAQGIEAEVIAPGCDTANPGTPGFIVGQRPRFGKGGGYTRGASREEMREHLQREAEARSKRRVYIFMGGKK